MGLEQFASILILAQQTIHSEYTEIISYTKDKCCQYDIYYIKLY